MKPVNHLVSSIVVILLIVNGLGFGRQSPYRIKEKEKPIPLADLQNPDSPSYVPIPYPKTREEVIIDFKYFIKRDIEHRKRIGRGHANPPNSFSPLRDLFNKKPKIKIGIIRKAKNLSASSPKHYFFFDVTDLSGKVIMKIAMRDTGHYSTSNHRKVIPMPLSRSLEEGLATFKKKVAQFRLNHETEDLLNAKLEYVVFSHGICIPMYPLVSVKLKNAHYFLDARDRLFVVKKSEPLTYENNKRRGRENFRNLRENNILSYSLKDHANRKLISIEEVK